jgi:hypothetical protein
MDWSVTMNPEKHLPRKIHRPNKTFDEGSQLIGESSMDHLRLVWTTCAWQT